MGKSQALLKLEHEKEQLNTRKRELQAIYRSTKKITPGEQNEWDHIDKREEELDYLILDENKKIEFQKNAVAYPDLSEQELERRAAQGFASQKSNPPSKELFSSLGEFMQAVLNAKRNPAMADHRLLELNAWGNKYQAGIAGAGTAPLEDGAYFLQTNFQNEIIRCAIAESVLWKKCRQFQLDSYQSSLSLPVMRDKNRAYGSRLGGLTLGWAQEGGEISDSKVKFDKIEISTSKLAGLSYVTNELLSQAPLMSQIYSQCFSEELSFVVDDTIIRGNGSGGAFLGILNSGALVTVTKETNQASGSLVPQNVVKMLSRLSPRSVKNAMWLYNQDILPNLHLMSMPVGTAGVPVFLPGNNLTQSPFGNLLGIPMQVLEMCETAGTVGDIVLADLTQYIIVQQGLMKLDISEHVKFTSDQTAFRLTISLGGQSIWSDPVTPYKGSNTVSPFVALQTR